MAVGLCEVAAQCRWLKQGGTEMLPFWPYADQSLLDVTGESTGVIVTKPQTNIPQLDLYYRAQVMFLLRPLSW